MGRRAVFGAFTQFGHWSKKLSTPGRWAEYMWEMRQKQPLSTLLWLQYVAMWYEDWRELNFPNSGSVDWSTIRRPRASTTPPIHYRRRRPRSPIGRSADPPSIVISRQQCSSTAQNRPHTFTLYAVISKPTPLLLIPHSPHTLRTSPLPVAYDDWTFYLHNDEDWSRDFSVHMCCANRAISRVSFIRKHGGKGEKWAF